MVLLRIILIALLIYYALKFIGRLLFPWLFEQAIKNSPYAQGNSVKDKKRDGGVTVQDLSKEKNKVIDKDEGEYIDYEEIK